MKHIFFKRLLVIALLALPLSAVAEDTDLFVGVAPSTTDLPNVLIVLDNTANWNSAFTNEIAALAAVVNGLPADKFRVGIAMFTETGAGNTGNDGGYVRAAVRTLNASNKQKYSALVSSLDKVTDKGNGAKAGLAMAEAYRYFSGGAAYAGNNKVKTDYTGNVSGTTADKAIYALSSNALSTQAAPTYNSPVASGSCAKSFIIYISNGAANDNSSDTSTATTMLSSDATAVGIANATTVIPISPSGSSSNISDEWARFMKKSSLGIVTYTVDIDKVTSGQGPGWTALLKSMAGVSSGKYFDVNSTTGAGSQINIALNKIFSEIQDVNSVFAAVSLPVSVNTQGTFLNQVYIGMFRPDADGFPRWAGNLKQYKLGLTNNVLALQDADGTAAINSGTGFITSCARSFWTPSTIDSYWAFKPQGTCTIANVDTTVSNYPDGNIVEKGAASYQLRSTTTRTVKTCSSTFASCTTLTNFDNTNVTQADLGAATTTDRDDLINWERGLDVTNTVSNNGDENLNGITSAEMRPSAHGDIVHSRPVAINFGTDAARQVVVFYGSNDGMLHAINGNRTGLSTDKEVAISGSTVAAGGELWSFVAPEFYANIIRLRDNTVPIKFYGTTVTSPTPLPKAYGIDGSITSYKDSSRTFIYAGMRRGGRVLYAFDVTTPASPSLKWKKGCPNLTDDTNCTTDFTGIGQTWSSAKTLKSSGYGSGASPMIMMGGGYDNCEDGDPNTCGASPKGNHVYVMDADTGTLLKTFNTTRSVIADVFVVPDTSTGLAKYAYAVDTGGNIYRISGADANSAIGTTLPANWTITQIAALGCANVTACNPNRKFMFSPSIVDNNGVYELMIGSGDREKPLTAYTSASSVSNYFFMVKDKPTDSAWLTSENTSGGACGANMLCLNSLLAIAYNGTTPTAANLATKKGWYLGLTSTEQVVTSSVVVFNTITFSTHTPATTSSTSCSANLGLAKVYNLSRINASTTVGTVRGETIAGGGLPPSPVAGMVTLDNGTTLPFIIGSKSGSPLDGAPPPLPPTTTQPKARVYWYIQQ